MTPYVLRVNYRDGAEEDIRFETREEAEDLAGEYLESESVERVGVFYDGGSIPLLLYEGHRTS